jgi:hypothetical protein
MRIPTQLISCACGELVKIAVNPASTIFRMVMKLEPGSREAKNFAARLRKSAVRSSRKAKELRKAREPFSSGSEYALRGYPRPLEGGPKHPAYMGALDLASEHEELSRMADWGRKYLKGK